MVPHQLLHSCGLDHQRGAAWLPPHEQAGYTAVFAERRIRCHPGVRLNTWCSRCRLEKDLIEMFSALSPPGDRQPGNSREASLGCLIAEVVAHTIERGATHRLAQSQPVQDGPSARQQPLAARFFFGKSPALEDLNR